MVTQRAMNTREWIMLFGLASLWSTSFFFFKVLLVHLPVLTIVFGRVSLAAIVLWAVVYLSGQRMPTQVKVWGAFILMGALANVIPFSLIILSEKWIGSGLAAILNATTPLFAVVLMHFATRNERLSAAKAVGLILGFLGVVVLVAPTSLAAFKLGGLATIVASAVYAIAGLYGKRFSGVPPLVTAAGMLTGSALLLVPFMLFIDKPWQLQGLTLGNTWFALGALAFFCTALAYILYFRILATAGVTNLTLVTFIVPVGAVAVGAAFLHEAVSLRTILGAAIIFAGLAAIDGRLFARFRKNEMPTADARAA
jgi:drug/metabolite transporter (DMT)-like permease